MCQLFWNGSFEIVVTQIPISHQISSFNIEKYNNYWIKNSYIVCILVCSPNSVGRVPTNSLLFGVLKNANREKRERKRERRKKREKYNMIINLLVPISVGIVPVIELWPTSLSNLKMNKGKMKTKFSIKNAYKIKRFLRWPISVGIVPSNELWRAYLQKPES